MCGKDPAKFESVVKEAEEKIRFEAESRSKALEALPQTVKSRGMRELKAELLGILMGYLIAPKF